VRGVPGPRADRGDAGADPRRGGAGRGDPGGDRGEGSEPCGAAGGAAAAPASRGRGHHSAISERPAGAPYHGLILATSGADPIPPRSSPAPLPETSSVMPRTRSLLMARYAGWLLVGSSLIAAAINIENGVLLEAVGVALLGVAAIGLARGRPGGGRVSSALALIVAAIALIGAIRPTLLPLGSS